MERSIHQQRVDSFMRQVTGQTVPDRPTEPSEKTRQLRAKLIFEEAMETIRKGLGVRINVATAIGMLDITDSANRFDFGIVAPYNEVETVDGCCDIKVVTTGTLSACGVSDEGPQRLVDEANLAKFGPGHYVAGPNDPNGFPEGKLIKPKDWTPPDLVGELDRQLSAAIDGMDLSDVEAAQETREAIPSPAEV